MDELNQIPVDAGQEIIEESHEVEAVEIVEEPKQSAELNRIAAAARKEAEQKAKAYEEKIRRLEEASKKGGFNSVDEFTEAYEQQLLENEERIKRSKLEEQGIDPDVYEQMIQNDPRIKKATEREREIAESEQRQKNFIDFLDYFKQTAGRPFDAEKDKVSQEVIDMTTKGIPLIVAYKAVDETTMLKNELAELKEKFEASETNKKNSATSTGNLNPATPNDSEFISKEIFEANKSDQRWVMKNLEKLNKSRTKW